MKKCFLILSCIFFSANVMIADVGDTTVIISHDHTHMNWYGAWDNWTVFPDAANSYNKILLQYTLGCPDNGCSDWDYTTMVEIKEHTGIIDSNLQSHIYFTANGESPDSVFLNYEEQWKTFYNEDISATDSILADSIIILVYRDTIFPISFTDSIFAFQARYYNYYFDSTGIITDSIYVGYDTVFYNYEFNYYKPFEVINYHELARVITPYGGNYSNNWELTYTFDVTDFSCLLHDSVEIRLFYSGWSDGFEGTLKFEMIEGIPTRKSLTATNLYHGYFPYGMSPAIEHYLVPKKVKIKEDSKNVKVSITPTGHGFGGNENCSEFCAKNYILNIDGISRFTELIWTDKCGLNPLYHQAGTWLYDRANWCPGSKGIIKNHEITPFVIPGDSVEFDLNMDEFTNIDNSNPGYQIAATLFELGEPNFVKEVSVEEIIAPNKDLRYNRQNSICSRPIIVIKNNGTEVLSNLQIQYGFKNHELNEYQWTGQLHFLEQDTIILPSLDWGTLNEEDDEFRVEISQPNGGLDEVEYNNSLGSHFNLAPVWDIYAVLNLRTNKTANDTYYEIYNQSGELVRSVECPDINTIYKDTLRLDPGCYEFIIHDRSKNGLSFWANDQGSGFCKFYKLGTYNYYIQLPTDFGTEYRLQFTYSENVLTNSEILGLKKPELNIQPNVSHDIFKMNATRDNIKMVKVVDLQGKVLFFENNTIQNNNYLLDISNQKSGIYIVIVQVGEYLIREKIVKL